MRDGHRVVDAHQHLWRLEDGGYDWLTPDAGPLHASFSIEDVEPAAAACGIDDVVLVQADGSARDTDAMLAAAARWPRVAAVVGWAPLTDRDGLERALERFVDEPLIVGVRHQIHDEPDPDWVVRPDVLDSLGRLADAGLTYDVVAVAPRHLEHVPTLAAAHPGLRLAVDHLAKPPLGAGHGPGSPAWTSWVEGLRAAARHPSVVAKLSGLDTAAGAGYDAATLRPALEVALEAFGAERLMFGTDWPVSILADGYERWWRVTQELLAPLSEHEQEQVLGTSARAFYRWEERR